MPLSPRIGHNSAYQVVKEVEIIHQVITTHGPTIQHDKIVQLLTSPNNAQRQELIQNYRSKYGGADLAQALKDKLPPSEVATNSLYLALLDTPAEHDAKYLSKAMKVGFGTDEGMLIEILVTRSNAQLRAIKAAYQKLYNRELEKDLAAETSGSFKTLLLDLVEANRDETYRTDPVKAKADAEKLYKAGEGKWGTDEDAFIKVLANQSLNQLQMMFNEYEKLGKKHTMEQAVKAEFSGDELSALLAIVSFVRNGPIGEVAEMLHKSLTKGGKDDMLIHLIVAHSELDLGDIAQEYEKRFKTPLEHAVETSGKPSTLKNALIRMIKGNK
uniref:Annexin n=1 Tax=Globodera pallida TaxID=36090 RepID=A0A183BRL8_GLOPA